MLGHASPTDTLLLHHTLKRRYLYSFPDPVQSWRSWRKQSSSVFCFFLEQTPVFVQANCTLNSPDSSGGASCGQWCCLRPPHHGHAHQSWPFTSASGISLWRGCPSGGLRSPLAPTASKPPCQSSAPVPPCWVHGEDSGCSSGHGDCLGPGFAEVLHPNVSSPQAPLPAPCPESQLAKDGTSISICLSSIPLSIPAPALDLLPLLSQDPLLWPAPELPMPWWPGSAPLVLSLPGPMVSQVPQIQLFRPAVIPLAASDSPSHHTSLLPWTDLRASDPLLYLGWLRSLDIAGSSWT